MMDGALEFFPQRAGVFGGDARDEHALPVFQKLGGDFDDLLRRLARAENDFGKIFAQRAVRVHLRKAEVGHRRGLEGAQDLVAAHAAGAELFQQAGGFGSCHALTMPQESALVTRET